MEPNICESQVQIYIILLIFGLILAGSVFDKTYKFFYFTYTLPFFVILMQCNFIK